MQRNPSTFVVFRDGKFQSVIHAYSREQAKRLAPSGATVLPVRKGSPLYHDIYRSN